MAWSTPLTAVSNAALTAAQWNASVRDDLLETAPAKATTAGQIFVATGANAIAARLSVAAFVASSETTASTSYVGLTTPGPAVTVTCGPFVLVGVSASMSQSTNGTSAFATFAITGASSAAGSDLVAVSRQFATAASDSMRASAVMIQTGMTGGSNTFTMQYRVSAGTGTYSARNTFVVPF